MKKIFIYLLLLFSTVSFGQVNLVPNPSFEDTVACPTTANQVDRAVGWHASRESPDYFNKCDFITGTTSVPANFCGYQYAHSGDAYCGFIAYVSGTPNGREFFTCQLINPLVANKKYNVSFYLSLSGTLARQIACNKIGLRFSNVNYNLIDTAYITNNCQFYTDSIITDSLNWTLVSGSFIADSNYTHLTVGNFFDDISTDTILLSQAASSYANYYIDDLSVSEDTTTSITNYDRIKSIIIFPNPTYEKLNIVSKSENIYKAEVFDTNQKKVLETHFEKNRKEIEVNTSTIQNGVYYLKLYYPNDRISFHKFLNFK
jgi:hypothetical protein